MVEMGIYVYGQGPRVSIKVLILAQRLNTIMDSNRVMVLDQGNIAELDSPDNLLANKETIFYSMAKNAGIVA